jgi:hypothetical protein
MQFAGAVLQEAHPLVFRSRGPLGGSKFEERRALASFGCTGGDRSLRDGRQTLQVP